MAETKAKRRTIGNLKIHGVPVGDCKATSILYEKAMDKVNAECRLNYTFQMLVDNLIYVVMYIKIA